MEFLEAKKIRDELAKEVEMASDALKEFLPFRNSMGLIPDHIKESKLFQDKKRAFNFAFEKQRDFNAFFVKQFKKEIREEQKSKRGKYVS